MGKRLIRWILQNLLIESKEDLTNGKMSSVHGLQK